VVPSEAGTHLTA